MGYTCGRRLTKSFCMKEARKYGSIAEFAKADSSCYQSAKKYGILDRVFDRKWTPRGFFTREKCFELASECRGRSEFKKRFHTAWKLSYDNGWMEDYTWFLSRGKLTRKVSDEEVTAAAMKYSTGKDFRTKDPHMWNMAWRRGLLPGFTWLSRKEEIISRGFTDMVYAYEFPEQNRVYVGRTVEPRRRDASHRKPGDPVYEFATASGVPVPSPVVIRDGITPMEGAELECLTMEKYSSEGWVLLNSAPGGSLGALAAGKRTKEYCLEVARKYSTVSELVKNDMSVYNALMNNKDWYSECTWLKRQRFPKGTWSTMTKEELHAEAMKYDSRNAFMHGSKSAYEICRKAGYNDEWFPPAENISKKVAQYDLSGKLVMVHDSIADAARHIGVKHPQVSAICRHVPGKKTTRGFRFEFVNQ